MPIDAANTTLQPQALTRFIGDLFEAAGFSPRASSVVAEALVDADLSGIPSHGVMLVPMYLERVRAGSVSRREVARVVSDEETSIVLDAENALGQLTAAQAASLASERAEVHGVAAVAVRNAFHFGTAGRWAQQMAHAGCIGIAMSNTRPLMPAPGGAQRVVGNNPMAIAMPSSDGIPILLDMAMSASAMGKIRLAQGAGREIPTGWATDAEGVPTTDPAAAIAGMLLPAGGPKGFGLAFMIDLLCGGLSGGAVGDAVRPLYGDAATPYGCAHFFLALDPQRFLPGKLFAGISTTFADKVRQSTKAAGTERIYSPGELSWQIAENHRMHCPVATDVAAQLCALGRASSVVIPEAWQQL